MPSLFNPTDEELSAWQGRNDQVGQVASMLTELILGNEPGQPGGPSPGLATFFGVTPGARKSLGRLWQRVPTFMSRTEKRLPDTSFGHVSEKIDRPLVGETWGIGYQDKAFSENRNLASYRSPEVDMIATILANLMLRRPNFKNLSQLEGLSKALTPIAKATDSARSSSSRSGTLYDDLAEMMLARASKRAPLRKPSMDVE